MTELDIQIQDNRDAYGEASAMLEFFRMDQAHPDMIAAIEAKSDELREWFMMFDGDFIDTMHEIAAASDEEFNEMLEQGVIG